LSLPASASCSWYLISAPAFHFPPNVSSTFTFSQVLLSVHWAASFYSAFFPSVCSVRKWALYPSIPLQQKNALSSCTIWNFCLLSSLTKISTYSPKSNPSVKNTESPPATEKDFQCDKHICPITLYYVNCVFGQAFSNGFNYTIIPRFYSAF
jgi:hypothetical protein